MDECRAVVHSVYKELATAPDVVERMLCDTLNTSRFYDDVEPVSSRENSSSDCPEGGRRG